MEAIGVEIAFGVCWFGVPTVVVVVLFGSKSKVSENLSGTDFWMDSDVFF